MGKRKLAILLAVCIIFVALYMITNANYPKGTADEAAEETATTTSGWNPSQEYQIPEIEWVDQDGNVLENQEQVLYAWWQGPNGLESYCQMDPNEFVQNLRDIGMDEEHYPVWVRYDGMKMFGPYVICAANLEEHPIGSIVQGKFGEYIVVAATAEAQQIPEILKIAVDW